MQIIPYTNSTTLEISWKIKPNPHDDSQLGNFDDFYITSGPDLELDSVELEGYQDILDETSVSEGQITEIDIVEGDVDEDGSGSVTAHVTIGSTKPFVLSQEDLDYIADCVSDQLMDEDAIQISTRGSLRWEEPYVNTNIDGWYDTREEVDDDYSETVSVVYDGGITVKILKETKTEAMKESKLLKESVDSSLTEYVEETLNAGGSGNVAVYTDQGELVALENIYDILSILDFEGNNPDDLLVLEDFMQADLEEGDDYYTPDADYIFVVL